MSAGDKLTMNGDRTPKADAAASDGDRLIARWLRQIELRREDDGVAIADHVPEGQGALFGGLILAHVARAFTLSLPERPLHAFHGFFLRPGRHATPIRCRVEKVRDGRSFSVRRLNAEQDGKVIFTALGSFQETESGCAHSAAPPAAAMAFCGKKGETPGIADLPSPGAPDQRFVELREAFSQEGDAAVAFRRGRWFRPASPSPISLPADAGLQAAMLAYVSDMFLFGTAVQPHRSAASSQRRRLALASLDHAMWFYPPFSLDDWLLAVFDSPRAGGARGFCRGLIYDRNGRVVAAAAQEGMMRSLPS